MLLGNLFQQLYNLVDSIVVGQFVGPNALAAIGATGSTTFMFFALCNGIGNKRRSKKPTPTQITL